MRQTILALAVALSIAVCVPRTASVQSKNDTAEFGIYVSTLDGKNVKRLISDSSREMNHARVSPDHEWITFTRYNKKGFLGSPAVETNGYDQTEIMLMKADGSGLRTLVAPGKDAFAANGYWTPDGRGILFVSKAPGGATELRRYDLASNQSTVIPGPPGMWVTDPHQALDKIVFAAQDPKTNRKNAIWIMDADGGNIRQITNPAPGKPLPIDFDPKLSPDGKSVAVMRQVGKDNWHTVVVDLATNKERDLSAPEAVDGVPEWSSDGRLLIFWHVNPKDLQSSGLYTMRADGTQRTRIPLPRGFFYTMPAFFPGDGSTDATRIIFSARRNPAL
jgi:Tol biopolymer transport system component